VENLKIQHGEMFGLIGESGCGKTTFLKVIAGLLSPDKGSVFQDGKDITSIPPEKRSFGMVFQQDRLFPYMTVEQNVAFGLKMKGLPPEQRSQLSEQMLGTLGLSGMGKRFPLELSGGQRQRVAIARAMVISPSILLMDEPFSALDPNLRNEMRELVLELRKEYSMTTIFVTHDREEAFMMFDRMSIMKNGTIVETGHPRKLYERPEKLYTAQFLGIRNIIPGKVKKGLFISGTDPELRIRVNREEGSGYLVMRPESMEIDQDTPPDTGFQSFLVQTAFRQGMMKCILRTSSGRELHLLQKSRSFLENLTGTMVTVGYRPEELVFIRDEKGGLPNA
jgi:ABC-type Fe3+/spermidine/putrescine transport system ATPase subunit